jgi:biotin carboxylase
MAAVSKGRKPRVMVVTAGAAQSTLVLKAKDLGCEVLATDINGAAPALTLADRSVVVDAADRFALLDVASGFQLQAILTEQTDIAVASVAFVAAELGLPGISPAAAVKATDKWQLREACRHAAVNGPCYRLAVSADEAIAAAREIGLPVIVKPADNQGSRGVTKVFDLCNLRLAAVRALAASRSGRILVEELLVGAECSVESFICGDGVHVLAIGERTTCEPPYSYGLQQIYPATFPDETLDDIRRLNEAVVRAVGISMGFSHAEMIVTADGVRIIEIAARGCGARVATQLLPRMSGIDLLGLRLRQAMGEDVSIPEASEGKAGMFRFFQLPEGTVRSIEGITMAAALEGVLHLEVGPPVGSRVFTPVDAGDRPGFVLAVARTRPDVIALTEKAMGLVKIEVV